MPNNNPFGLQWPEEHAAELVRLAGEKLSYRAIAAAINEKFGTAYTKNSTIGKAARLGLSKEAAPSVPGNHRPNPNRVKPYVARAPRKKIETVRIVSANGNSNAMRAFRTVSVEMIRLRCIEIIPLNISFEDLEPHHCRYPQDGGFCGHFKASGSSYCDAHHALCHEQPRIPIHRFARHAA